LVERVFLEDLLKDPNKISKLDIVKISHILQEAKDVISNDTFCLELEIAEQNREVYVLGDIHGNLKSLLKIVHLIDDNNPEFVIFLGDYVDRGEKQLECFMLVLILKILNPKKYYLLRGNHESLEMNEYYGFLNVFLSKFNYKQYFNKIIEIYEVLPYCAIINDCILCIHGGIPEDFDTIRKLKEHTHKEDINMKSLNIGLFQMLWNDPKDNISGFETSYRGPGIRFFGKDVFNKFMDANNLKYMISSHEMFPEGFKWFFNKQLLSIFSSENYGGEYNENLGSYAIVRKNCEIIAKLMV